MAFQQDLSRVKSDLNRLHRVSLVISNFDRLHWVSGWIFYQRGLDCGVIFFGLAFVITVIVAAGSVRANKVHFLVADCNTEICFIDGLVTH